MKSLIAICMFIGLSTCSNTRDLNNPSLQGKGGVMEHDKFQARHPASSDKGLESGLTRAMASTYKQINGRLIAFAKANSKTPKALKTRLAHEHAVTAANHLSATLFHLSMSINSSSPDWDSLQKTEMKLMGIYKSVHNKSRTTNSAHDSHSRVIKIAEKLSQANH